MSVQVVNISLPSYQIEGELEYDLLGETIDSHLMRVLPEGSYAERSIGLIDHPGKSLEDLVEIILKQGTDKYDPDRKSVFDEEFSCFNFDIHASEFSVSKSSLEFEKSFDLSTYFGQNIFCFHQLAPIDRGYPVRIGISLIYDRMELLPAIQIRPCEERLLKYSKYLFRFRTDHPLDALRAMLVIH